MKSEDRPTLRPCPFCGSTNLAFAYEGQPAVRGFITCLGCGASGPQVSSSSLSGGAIDLAKAAELWGVEHKDKPASPVG